MIVIQTSNPAKYDSGAGDQGLMFGYATDETEELMPLTCTLAHQLNHKLSELRRNGVMGYLRADSKTQVTIEYAEEGGACIPLRVHTVVVSTQHDAETTLAKLQADVKEKVIKVRYSLSSSSILVKIHTPCN